MYIRNIYFLRISCLFKLFFTLTIILGANFYGFAQQNKSYGIKKVVLDAGHGGHDPGCLGKKVKEKDVALAITLKLGAYIQQNLPDVKVIYTRDTDKFVELHERAAIANRNKADFFISIHCNSGKNPASHGCETYAMGLHVTTENLNVAKRENSSILMEKNYEAKYDGFNPNAPEANIIFTLYQNAYLDESLELASMIQDHFRESAGRHDRSVKQAGFMVLFRTAMPSILIETGFLTNADEEEFLASAEGQDKMSLAIFTAFKDYKAQLEGRKLTPEARIIEPVKKIDTVAVPVKNTFAPHDSTANLSLVKVSPDSTVKKDTLPLPERVAETVNIEFAVQIASSTMRLPGQSSEFKGIKDVREYPMKEIINIL
jgi:N-acetylmuramoyl-L-alanine amidase